MFLLKWLFFFFVLNNNNNFLYKRAGNDERFNDSYCEKNDKNVSNFYKKQLLDKLTSFQISDFDKLKLIRENYFLFDN